MCYFVIKGENVLIKYFFKVLCIKGIFYLYYDGIYMYVIEGIYDVIIFVFFFFIKFNKEIKFKLKL